MVKDRAPLDYSGIFFDSANLADFARWQATGILGGATLNPVLLGKENVTDLPRHLGQMIDIAGSGFPISVEIPDSKMSLPEMVNLAVAYHKKYPTNAVIKVPMDPRNPQKPLKVMKELARRGVRVNATLGLGMGQLVGAAEALRDSQARGDNYVSLFAGRRNEEAERERAKLIVAGRTDPGEVARTVPDAWQTLSDTLGYLVAHGLSARVIVGSIRSPDQVETAFSLGADVVTLPPQVIDAWMFSQRGAETIEEFDGKYREVQTEVNLFPPVSVIEAWRRKLEWQIADRRAKARAALPEAYQPGLAAFIKAIDRLQPYLEHSFTHLEVEGSDFGTVQVSRIMREQIISFTRGEKENRVTYSVNIFPSTDKSSLVVWGRVSKGPIADYTKSPNESDDLALRKVLQVLKYIAEMPPSFVRAYRRIEKGQEINVITTSS